MRNWRFSTLLIVAMGVSTAVGLAKAADQQKKSHKKPEVAQPKAIEPPPCPPGCIAGRKSGLLEHLSKCPDNCRPTKE